LSYCGKGGAVSESERESGKLRGNSGSLLVNGINEFSDFRAENYKLVVQLLINLCRCGESLAENVYLVFVRKYLEIFGVLFIRGNLQTIRLFTVLLQNNLISKDNTSINFISFHQILSEKSLEISLNYDLRVALLNLLFEIVKRNYSISSSLKKRTENDSEQENQAWPDWFYKFLKSCRSSGPKGKENAENENSPLHPTAYKLINFLRKNKPGQLDADFIIDEITILENFLKNFKKPNFKNLKNCHDICVNLQKISLSGDENSDLYNLCKYSIYLSEINEYNRAPPSWIFGSPTSTKNKLTFTSSDIQNDNNACVTTNFYNQIICSIFYENLKYAKSEVIKSKNFEKELVEISTISTKVEEVNFALTYLQVDFGRKNSSLFQIGEDSKQNQNQTTINIPNRPLLPLDWALSPIIDLYLKKSPDQTISDPTKEEFLICLKIFSKIIYKLEGILVYNRLLCLSLSCSNIFSGHKSNEICQIIFEDILSTKNKNFNKISIITPEVKSLYLNAVDYYDGAGYNNIIFTDLLLFLLCGFGKITEGCQNSSIFIELHNYMFYTNFRIVKSMNKFSRFKFWSTSNEDKISEISKISPSTKKSAAIIARNLLYFTTQTPTSDFDGELFIKSIEYLKEFFGLKNVEYVEERESLKRDCRSGRLYGRFFEF